MDERVNKSQKKPGSSVSSRVRPGRQGLQSRAGLQLPLEYPLALSEVPLFRALSRRQLRRVARLAKGRRYSDEVVVRAGARGDAFYVIIDGKARVEAPGGHVQTLFPGDSFGELALLDGAPRAATVVAVGELVTAIIERSDFLRLVGEEPGMALALIRGVVAMIREMRKGLVPAGPLLAELALDAAPSSNAPELSGTTPPGWLSTMSQVPLFRELGGRQLGRVIKLAELRRYGAGAVIVRTGAPGDAFHIILDGRALVETPERQEHVLKAGDSFGELALIDNAPRAATITAIDDVTTARLGRPAFLRLVRDEPAIATGVLRGLVRIVRDIES